MHAYLIMAHKNLEQIKKLLKLLDYSQNDIYIHIDTKADDSIKFFDYTSCCTKSKVIQSSLFKSAWGSYSLVECELFLLRQATENRKYDYYHLISGMDLPLKNQLEIHQFFKKNNGKQFVHFSGKNSENECQIKRRVKYYWATSYYNFFSFIDFRIVRRIDYFQIRLQELLHINRLKNNNLVFYHGSQWFSITDELARDLLKEKDYIERIYKNTNCCDELFLQTFIANNDKWFSRLYDSKMDDDYCSNVRKIDWSRGGPYVWTKKDFNELIDSDCMFARKFDEKVDPKIIELLCERILLKGNKCEK